VPEKYRKWEQDREELRKLQGDAQQLKNAVYRQRRIRFLNEKNAATAENRRARFQVQLAEMNSDLDILKDRLNEELKDLGIDQSKARQLLSDYYKIDDESDYDGSEKRKISDDEGEKVSRRKMELEPGIPSVAQ
jgi:hypothetical protein